MTVTTMADRPQLHHTAAQGWVNDPLGLTFHEGVYHLFFQYVPDQTDWAAHCHWGHATSTDLLHWTERPPALVPGDGDDGCWSGSVVSPADGGPVMFYTAVSVPDFAVGRVRRARPGDPGWEHWVKEGVVARLPAEVEARMFRDPFVFRDGDGWRMLVGAGLPDGTATALTYSSPDLYEWVYDGRLAERSTHLDAPVWTGALWECPQLFPLGDRHVLVVSVWSGDELHHVAYAVGDYRDGRFEPRSWGRLSHGPSYYAASAFLDEAGRRGLVYWLRAVADPGAGWAGALSVPHVLSLDGDRLVAAPHPNLAALRRAAQTGVGSDEPGPVDIEWSPDDDAPAVLRLDTSDGTSDGAAVAELRLADSLLTVTRRGPAPEESWSMPCGSGPVRVLVDGPVVEVFADGAVLAFPLAGPAGAVRPVVVDGGGALDWWLLTGR